MYFSWLKRYMPRSLYGRAALILILPVVTLQLLVSVVFIQRHFSGVTEQLTRQLVNEVDVVIDLPASPERDLIARRLDVVVEMVPIAAIPSRDLRHWEDLSGIEVIRVLQDRLRGLKAVQLDRNGSVVIYAVRNDQGFKIITDRGQVSASNPHQLLVTMSVFGLLMTVIAFLYLRNQLRPIMRLGAAAEAFGRGRVVPYSPGGATEVRAAGHAFLDMRARIERHIEQRTLMLSGVSHDLRTPLTRLRLGLSLLDHEDCEALERDVDDMQGLIDTFLDFARGMAQPEDTTLCDPNQLVAEICEGFQRTGAPVSFLPGQSQGEIKLRSTSIRRAVENLISNAIRYGGVCHVTVALTSKSLRIQVEDDGPGIAPEMRDQAVRPFVRLDRSRNQDKGAGVGLGMAIAADIARAHGGVLRLSESANLGGLRADIVIAR